MNHPIFNTGRQVIRVAARRTKLPPACTISSNVDQKGVEAQIIAGLKYDTESKKPTS
jgi:hypothetical protein